MSLVDQLRHQLTDEEKAALTGGASMWRLPGVPRLGLRALKMSDGPSGVRGSTFTRRSLVVPCGSALGATWNPALVGEVGRVLGLEARDKDVDVLLGPTVNIVRTPLAGRAFECLSEDPCLNSGLAVAYVRGVQAEGVGCCIKHFACNDQEHERMSISAEVDAATLREIHLPAFEAAVAAGVWAVMSAYNRLGGTYCSENQELLGAILKGEWGFDGVVVSDWFGTHSTFPAARAGLDIEMPGPATWLGPALGVAVAEGAVATGTLDEMATRVLRLMERTGALDPDRGDGVEVALDVPERRAVARRAATESMVLLANNGLLPLDPQGLTRVAVIGPNAARFEIGGGGSATVNPHRVVPPLDALRSRLGPDVAVGYQPGCQIDATCPTIDSRLLDGGGFDVELWDTPDAEGAPAAIDRVVGGRIVWLGPPAEGIDAGGFAARGHAGFVPDRSGMWQVSLESAGRSRLWLDGTLLVDNWEPTQGATLMGIGSVPVAVETDLEAGRRYELLVELRMDNGIPLAGVRIGAASVLPDDALGAAVSAAADAEVAIVVVGTTPDHESEGFDRTGLGLPGDQDELVARVVAANPNTVVVVNAGAPVAMPWAEDPAAVLAAWFPGEEGGEALVDVLLGDADPGGRLPVTFPRRIEDTPTFGSGRRYPGQDGRVVYEEGTLVGYRHYDEHGITPLWPFGHGLSYTWFEYGPLRVTGRADGGAEVCVALTNRGARRGVEVVQCYVVRSGGGPRRLAAFAKVELAPGAATDVVVAVPARAFAHWDTERGQWSVPPGTFDVLVGASSTDIRVTAPVPASG